MMHLGAVLMSTAQTPVEGDYLDVKNGLSQNSAKKIIQDRFGFIWIATEDGLNRFDGYNFKVLKHQFNSSSIPDNNIVDVAEDPDTLSYKIWILTANHITLYDVIANRLLSFAVPGEYNRFFKLIIDGGHIYLIGKYRSYLFDRATHKFTTLHIPLLSIRNVVCYQPGILLAAGDEGLFRIRLTANHYELITPDKILDLVQDKNGSTYAINSKGDVYWINRTSMLYAGQNVFKNNTLDTDDLQCSFIGSSGKLWLGSSHGLYVSEGIGDEDVNKVPPQVLQKNNVRCVLEDHFGNTWIGTYGGGITIIKKTKDNFRKINSHTEDVKLSSDYVLSFYKDSSYLWVGTDGAGLNRISTDHPGGTKYYTRKHLLQNEIIFDIKPFHHKLIVAGGRSVVLFDPRTETSIPLVKQLPVCEESYTKTICVNGDKVWIGRSCGLFEYQEGKGIRSIPVSDHYKQVRCLLYDDKRKVLWVGSNTGLFCVDSADRITPFLNHGIRSSFNISSLLLDTIRQQLYIGTVGQGLCILNLKNKYVRFVNSTHGLVNDIVYGLQMDEQHNLWMSTNQGLVKFSTLHHTFKNYTIKDGLQSNEFNGGASYKDKDGVLYFGGINGFNYFMPELVAENKLPAKVLLTTLEVNEHAYNPDSVVFIKTLELDHTQNYLTFELSSTDFTAPGESQFAYKLSGADQYWIYAKKVRQAHYNFLPPGSYTFLAKTTNSNGVWGPEKALFTIVIKPPFWLTWWFITAAVLFIGASVVVVFRLRVHHIKKKEKERTLFAKRLADLEVKALRAQMNPHFIFHVLNVIQDHILDNNVTEASKYLAKFAKLIRLILDNTDQQQVILGKKINLLKLYLEIESLRFNNTLKYEIDVDPSLDVNNMSIPNMIIQPFVEHALWYGLTPKDGSRRLHIIFSRLDDQKLFCEIIDNGVSRADAINKRPAHTEEREWKGLRFTFERLSLLSDLYHVNAGAEITDHFEHNQPSGTKVKLTLPIT